MNWIESPLTHTGAVLCSLAPGSPVFRFNRNHILRSPPPKLICATADRYRVMLVAPYCNGNRLEIQLLLTYGFETNRKPRLRLVVAAAEEFQHALHDLLLRVDSVQDARPCQWVAGEETLVEHLAAAKGAARDVPRESKQLDAIARRRVVGGEVLLDIRGERAREIRLARDDHKAAGPEQLQDLDHARISGHKQVARNLRRHLRGTHHAPFIDLSVGFGGAQARPHQFRVHHQLAQPFL